MKRSISLILSFLLSWYSSFSQWEWVNPTPIRIPLLILKRFFFIDSDNGYVAGWNGAVLKTSNGGIVGLNIKITAVN